MRRVFFSSSRSSIEFLETRIAPATVTVSFAAGFLTLSSDGECDVEISQVGPNAFRISVDDTVTTDTAEPVSGSFIDVKGPLTGILFNGSNGDDSLTLKGLRGLKGVGTREGIKFLGGSGVDSFTARDVEVAGNVLVDLGTGGADGQIASFGGNRFRVSGVLDVIAGDSGSDVAFTANASSVGRLMVTGGAGDDSLEVKGMSATFGREIVFNGADGDNSVTVTAPTLSIGKSSDATRKGRSLTVMGGAGRDDLDIYSGISASLKGSIFVDAGDGENRCEVKGSLVSFGGSCGASLSYTGGSGNDSVLVDGSRLTVARSVAVVNAGGGENKLTISGASVSVGKDGCGDSVVYKGEGGTDDLEIDVRSAKMSGGIRFNPGDGDNSLVCAGSSLTLGASTSAPSTSLDPLAFGHSILYVAGDGGTDELVIDYSTLIARGALEMTVGANGGGFNAPSLMGFSVGGESVTVGKSASSGRSIAVMGNEVGPTTSEVELGSRNLTLFGDLLVTGIQGGLSLDVNADQLSIRGAIQVVAGSGADTVSILADGVVAKLATVDLGNVDAFEAVSFNDSTAIAGDTITIVSHGFEDGDQVVYDGSGGSNIGLSTGTVYYVKKVDNDQFSLLAAEADTTPVILTAATGGGVDVVLLVRSEVASAPQEISISGKSGNRGFTGKNGDGLIFRDGLALKIDTGDTVGQAEFHGGRPSAVKDALDSLVEENVILENVAVEKAFSAVLGNGASGVDIDNFVARAGFALNTGAGNDTVAIEMRSLFGSSSIAGIANIQLGSGDDRIDVGNAGESDDAFSGDAYRNDVVNFGRSLTVLGGGGSDTCNDIGGTNIFKAGVVPTLTGLIVDPVDPI
jgi:hypothetical protein